MSDEWRTDMTKNAFGGTEQLMSKLIEIFGHEYLEPFQIIPSRVKELKQDKIRILWAHDCGSDPMYSHLANGGWKKFHKIVFVSYLQREEFLLRYGIPKSHTTILHNAIEPFKVDIEKKVPKKTINLVYHTTPHRGLNILIPVFEKLSEKHDNIRLDVFSSFKIYGWEERDKDYQNIFDHMNKNEKIKSHGYVPHETLRNMLPKYHIFAYPSIWQETSSLCLMEAMSAGLMCCHSSLGALPETAANWTMMYDFHEDLHTHANIFYNALDHCINIINTRFPVSELKSQKSYVDLFNSWTLRKMQWEDLFNNLKSNIKFEELPYKEDEVSFVYQSQK